MSPQIERLLGGVGQLYLVNVETLLGPRRTRRVTQARRTAIWTLREGGLSFDEIAELMNRSIGGVWKLHGEALAIWDGIAGSKIERAQMEKAATVLREVTSGEATA